MNEVVKIAESNHLMMHHTSVEDLEESKGRISNVLNIVPYLDYVKRFDALEFECYTYRTMREHNLERYISLALPG